MVGMDAEKVAGYKEPTMVLSLKGFSKVQQRSMVIHEFGHALGLEHEHQCSDFWDTVEEYFDQDKMIKDPQAPKPHWSESVSGSEREWFNKVSNPLLAGDGEYDPNSIMHYRYGILYFSL